MSYDPDQPRADDGKWTSGGAGAGKLGADVRAGFARPLLDKAKKSSASAGKWAVAKAFPLHHVEKEATGKLAGNEIDRALGVTRADHERVYAEYVKVLADRKAQEREAHVAYKAASDRVEQTRDAFSKAETILKFSDAYRTAESAWHDKHDDENARYAQSKEDARNFPVAPLSVAHDARWTENSGGHDEHVYATPQSPEVFKDYWAARTEMQAAQGAQSDARRSLERLKERTVAYDYFNKRDAQEATARKDSSEYKAAVARLETTKAALDTHLKTGTFDANGKLSAEWHAEADRLADQRDRDKHAVEMAEMIGGFAVTHRNVTDAWVGSSSSPLAMELHRVLNEGGVKWNFMKREFTNERPIVGAERVRIEKQIDTERAKVEATQKALDAHLLKAPAGDGAFFKKFNDATPGGISSKAIGAVAEKGVTPELREWAAQAQRLIDANKEARASSARLGIQNVPSKHDVSPTMRAYVKETYLLSQAALRYKGIKPNDMITVYRGTDQKMPKDKDAAYESTRPLAQEKDFHLGTRPASSWTDKKSIADGFGSHTVKAEVPAKDVYAWHALFSNSYSENEFVLLGASRHRVREVRR